MIRESDSFDDLVGFHSGTDISQRRLSNRAYTILKRESVQTVGDLLTWTPEMLRGLRNCREEDALEIESLQRMVRSHRAARPGPLMGDQEGPLNFAFRVMRWSAWWEGHDASCVGGGICATHTNPYDTPEHEDQA